jgi:hypothetical protein
MKKSTKRYLLASAIFIGSLGLTLAWYDWKLFVIMMVFGWGVNLENQARVLERLGR